MQGAVDYDLLVKLFGQQGDNKQYLSHLKELDKINKVNLADIKTDKPPRTEQLIKLARNQRDNVLEPLREDALLNWAEDSNLCAEAKENIMTFETLADLNLDEKRNVLGLLEEVRLSNNTNRPFKNSDTLLFSTPKSVLGPCQIPEVVNTTIRGKDKSLVDGDVNLDTTYARDYLGDNLTGETYDSIVKWTPMTLYRLRSRLMREIHKRLRGVQVVWDKPFVLWTNPPSVYIPQDPQNQENMKRHIEAAVRKNLASPIDNVRQDLKGVTVLAPQDPSLVVEIESQNVPGGNKFGLLIAARNTDKDLKRDVADLLLFGIPGVTLNEGRYTFVLSGDKAREFGADFEDIGDFLSSDV